MHRVFSPWPAPSHSPSLLDWVVKRQVPEPHGLLRPMFLSPRRYARLEEMYLRHQVATEVRG